MPELDLDRRSFLKVVGLSAGAAATAACKEPVEAVIPYLNQPEEIIPGIPTYYASACRECPVGCSAQVKTREGRPIKVDGLDGHPTNDGALCVRGQASLYRTYDAARFSGPMKRDASGTLVAVTWEEALAELTEKLRPLVGTGRVGFLGGFETGTLDRVISGFMNAVGSKERVRFELFAYEGLRAANRALFGTDTVPHFALDRADVIVAFGTDFLETWLSSPQNAAAYAAGREGGKGYAAFVGPRLSVSGANTDDWVATKPGSEMFIALALAGEVARRKGTSLGEAGRVLGKHTLASAAEKSGVALETLEALATRLAKARSPLALPPGQELQTANASGFAAAVQLLNVATGAIGRTVQFGPNHNVSGLARFEDLKALAGKIRGGDIGALFVHNTNPVYSASQVGFADALENVYVVSFASANDETAALANLILPDHTPYEAWGDVESVAGVRNLQQPTVRPLFDTRATGDLLIQTAVALGRSAVAEGSFRDALVADWGGAGSFDNALAKGGSFAPAAQNTPAFSGRLDGLSLEPAELGGKGEVALLVYPSLAFGDGRSARIAMLNEISNPVTKLVWGSYAEMHPETATALGIEMGDVVQVTTEAGTVKLPAFPHEAVARDAIAIEAGQGHLPVDPSLEGVADGQSRRTQVGVNALSLLPGRLDAASGGLAWLSTRASVTATGENQLLPRTQNTFDQEGRGFAQSATLAAIMKSGEAHGDAHAAPAAEHGGGHGGDAHAMPAYAQASHLEVKEFDPNVDARDENYRWGMTIDLDKCNGCNACVAACNVENNIPTIGGTLVRQGREMHWIRIERYVEHHDDGSVESRSVPMLCQHCGAAPCESVCPVFATYHSREGLNVMVPNRCIGTRYCGNNCPYKVRRFNYFPYDTFIREPEHLALNPDVMVRSKGVMEKCSFCVQRINGAKDDAALEGRTVRDGEVKSACQAACGTGAITFGNYKDPESRISKNREDPRAYWILHHLNTRPAVTYLKSISRRDSHEA